MTFWKTKQRDMAAALPAKVAAREMGRSEAAVRAYRSRNKMTARIRVFSGEEMSYMRSARADGITWAQIAYVLGRSEQSCRQRMYEARKCQQ